MSRARGGKRHASAVYAWMMLSGSRRPVKGNEIERRGQQLRAGVRPCCWLPLRRSGEVADEEETARRRAGGQEKRGGGDRRHAIGASLEQAAEDGGCVAHELWSRRRRLLLATQPSTQRLSLQHFVGHR